MAAITGSQAVLNHIGVRLTSRITDISGYLILIVAGALTAAMLAFAPAIDPSRLVTFANHGGEAGGDVWPEAGPARLFALGLLLPALHDDGLRRLGARGRGDARRRAQCPARDRPFGARLGRGGVDRCWRASSWRSPLPAAAASRGDGAFPFALAAVLPRGLCTALGLGIALAMYGCGLGRLDVGVADGVCLRTRRRLAVLCGIAKSWAYKAPGPAIWTAAAASWTFTLWTPVYATITAVCVIFLYLSYVLPTALGAIAYGRSWRRMGPWDLGPWYRPLAIASVLGCAALIAIGVQPPNERAVVVLLGAIALLAAGWSFSERRRFAGPPAALLNAEAEDGPQ